MIVVEVSVGLSKGERSESALAEDVPRGDDGRGELALDSCIGRATSDQNASQIGPLHPSDPILGQPSADSEEKRGPARDNIGKA